MNMTYVARTAVKREIQIPLRANPGGNLAPQEVIGRDKIVARLWDLLDRQSLVLTSERRIGKTSIIRKAIETAPPPTLCISRDLEGLRTPHEFLEAIYHDLEPTLTVVDRARLGMWRLLAKLGGTQIGDLKLPMISPHWKNLFSALIADVCSVVPGKIVFFWDELPLFIYNIAAACGEKAAMEVLDVFRAQRQQHAQLRMVFAGSVGLHQLIGSLRRAGYANDPTNDMLTVEVPPLSSEHGAQLAELLITGEKIEISGSRGQVCGEVSAAAAHIPFYIHSLVARIKNDNAPLDSAAVFVHLDNLISDPDDPAHFSYYEERLRTYYPEADARVALAVLDILAMSPKSLSQAETFNLLKLRMEISDEDAFRRVVQTLIKDHYLTKDQDGNYAFRYSIIRRWWRHARG